MMEQKKVYPCAGPFPSTKEIYCALLLEHNLAAKKETELQLSNAVQECDATMPNKDLPTGQ